MKKKLFYTVVFILTTLLNIVAFSEDKLTETLEELDVQYICEQDMKLMMFGLGCKSKEGFSCCIEVPKH